MYVCIVATKIGTANLRTAFSSRIWTAEARQKQFEAAAIVAVLR